MWQTTRSSTPDSCVDGAEDFEGIVNPLHGPRSLTSIATFRVQRSKKKNTAQHISRKSTATANPKANLKAVVVSGSDIIPPLAELSSSHLQSPSKVPFSPSVSPISSTATAVHAQPPGPFTPSPPNKGKERGYSQYREYYQEPEGQDFDGGPTPTQARYDTSALLAAFSPKAPTPPVEEAFSPNESDTQSIRERTEDAMSQLKDALGGSFPGMGQDAFDSIDWDPDLPTASGPDSPEPVTIKPQPVTYTTVGSLVDPNAKPHFAAPNRIQREGANRQPLMSAMQRAQYDSFYQPRNPPPTPAALSMSNSMAYTQQIAKSPVHAQKQNLTPPQILQRPSRMASSQQMPPLTDKEAETLNRIQNPPRMMPANLVNQPKTPSSTSTTSSSKLCAVAPPFALKEQVDATKYSAIDSLSQEMMDSLGLGQGISNLGSRVNDDHRLMQVVESASKFPNALSGLIAMRDSNRNENIPPGLLDRTYQFPPPGLQAPQASQTNPLLGAQTASSVRSIVNRSHPPGYPQPLTAGPPGQRQANPRATPNPIENIWTTPQSDYTSSTSNDTRSAHNRMSPFWPNYYSDVLSGNVYATGQSQLPAAIRAERKGSRELNSRYLDPFAPKPMNDTLPPDLVAKYFPWGIPSDMTGVYEPMSDANQVKFDELELSAGQKKARIARELDDDFYYGQRRYATMDGEAYVTELEERQNAAVNPFGPIAPPKKIYPPGPALTKIITKDEMAKMSVADAAKPGLDAAFGTLLSYRYVEQGPTSRSHLSQFVTAPKWQIDESEKGNKSLFGEDWGAPPKRFGRDSRRQLAY